MLSLNKRYKESSVLVLSVVIIFLIVFLAFSSITLIDPRGKITDRSPIFEWSGNYDNYTLFVDDDSTFENPLLVFVLEVNYFEFETDLEFGEYYWKLVATKDGKQIESKPLKFEVVSLVAYSLDEEKLVNEGNSKSKLNSITGGVVLDPGQSEEVNGGNYTLEQDE
jgi:hypothetical protein